MLVYVVHLFLKLLKIEISQKNRALSEIIKILHGCCLWTSIAGGFACIAAPLLRE